MNIDLLSEIIRELIIDNDRVGLPELGDFVAEMLPATFSDKGYTINPPYRKIFFRKGKCSNNLIVKSYAASENISEEESYGIISTFVKEMTEVLEDKKVIVFPGLGKMRATKENHIFFVSEENLEINPAEKAMEPISLKAHSEDPSPANEVIPEEEPTKEEIIPEEEPAKPEEEPAVQSEEPVKEEITLQEEPAKPEKEAFIDRNFIERKQRADSRNKRKDNVKKIFTYVFIAAAAIIIFLILFAIMARVFPEFTDKLLYSKEELEILNHWK